MGLTIEQVSKLLSTLLQEIDSRVREELSDLKTAHLDAIIVLDDDPTGTQTVYDIPVLTEWDAETIHKEFKAGTPLFYILTNSRSLTESEAKHLAEKIGQNIRRAAATLNTRCWVISRSDSTLRGHYPAELNALSKGLQIQNGIQFIIPAFFEGGRYTVEDVHYVWQDGNLTPAAETPFARDAVFGYQNSNLKNWVEEKTKGLINAADVSSISLEDLQKDAQDQLVLKIQNLKAGSCCLVNALSYLDLELFSLGLIKAGVQPVFRTAASYVAALNCMPPRNLLIGKELVSKSGTGGILVVGSHVPATTKQLNHLLKNGKGFFKKELIVPEILNNSNPNQLVTKVASEINQLIELGKDVILYTSRELITGKSDEENQTIGQKVSWCMTNIIKKLTVKPRFLITKGGITSSDLATKALGVKKALVKGQIIKGVPVWELGLESKFPGLQQIIFPGNVGDETSLTEVFNLLQK